MIRRAACLSIFLTLVLLLSFGSESQIDQHGKLNASVKSGSAQRNAATRQSGAHARAGFSARMKGTNPPPSQIGFLGANQTAAGGAAFSSTSSSFPAVLGNFTGSGTMGVATVVNTFGVG